MHRYYGPIALMLFGVILLLIRYDVLPAGQIIWTAGLFVLGGYFLLGRRISTETFIPGGFFTVAGLISIPRHFKLIEVQTEIPILVIVLGALWLINRSGRIPPPAEKPAPPTEAAP